MKLVNGDTTITTADVGLMLDQADALQYSLRHAIPKLWDSVDESLADLQELRHHVQNTVAALQACGETAVSMDNILHTLRPPADAPKTELRDYSRMVLKVKSLRLQGTIHLDDFILNRMDEINDGILIPEAVL